jgi:hypothetical protein
MSGEASFGRDNCRHCPHTKIILRLLHYTAPQAAPLLSAYSVWTGLDPKPLHAGFVLNKLPVRHVFLRVLIFLTANIAP